MTTFLSECNKHYFDLNTVNYVIIQENNGGAIFGVVREGHQSPYYSIKIEDFERLRAALKASSVMVKCNKNDYVNGYKVSLSKFLSDKDRFDIHFTDGMEHYKYVQFTKPKKTLKRLSEMRVF